MSQRPEPFYSIGIRGFCVWVAARYDLRVEGLGHIPGHGPAILAANHVAHHDPVAIGAVVHRAGRRLRAMAIADIFDKRGLGWFLRATGQIPLERGRRWREGLALGASALRAGECILIYPEGRIVEPGETVNARAGVGKLALDTGVPVLPVSSWGLRPNGTGSLGGRVRSPAGLVIGPPLDLAPWRGRADRAAGREAAAHILEHIRAGLPAAEALAQRRR